MGKELETYTEADITEYLTAKYNPKSATELGRQLLKEAWLYDSLSDHSLPAWVEVTPMGVPVHPDSPFVQYDAPITKAQYAAGAQHNYGTYALIKRP